MTFNFDSSVLEDLPQRETNKLDEGQTLAEVEKSVKQLASGKAAGADGAEYFGNAGLIHSDYMRVYLSLLLSSR